MSEHVNYPHEPGYLYDCPACEASCHCAAGFTECVFDGNSPRAAGLRPQSSEARTTTTATGPHQQPRGSLPMEHDQFVGVDAETGEEFLLTVWADGTRTVAYRRHAGVTWGPPVLLVRESSEISEACS